MIGALRAVYDEESGRFLSHYVNSFLKQATAVCVCGGEGGGGGGLDPKQSVV